MKKNYPLCICIFCLIVLNTFILFSNLQSKNNQENYFRMHVVANSNSINDQIIKLNVVKKVENYLSSLYSNVSISANDICEKEYIKSIIVKNISNILNVANSELKNQNVNYSCYANIGKISYDEKKSDTINMDDGIYDSMQIVLGNGKGENFWSLIFPYSYNPTFDITTNSNSISNEETEFKSVIIETLKKSYKYFKFY